jgi:nucleotide-binding universal stress UspA family protein
MALEPIGPVVVGVDGSAGCLAAVDLAADEAAARVAPLLVVCADIGTAGRVVEDVLETAVARVKSEHPGLSVAAQAMTGDAVAALVDERHAACLVVVGHRANGGLCGWSNDSIATRVIADAHVPVIVHRPVDTTSEVPLPRPVLVGIRSEVGADSLAEFAFAEAAMRGAPLHAVHVSYGGGSSLDVLAEAVQTWSEKFPEVPVRRSIRPSLDAAVVLTAASRSSQLVVVGSSGSPRRLSAGSTVHALVHRAGCPVAVVPEH